MQGPSFGAALLLALCRGRVLTVFIASGRPVMDMGNDPSAVWLPLSEAASRMDLTVDGLRSRIRRGLVMTRRGNDKRLLVPISTDTLANGRDRDEQVREVIHDRSDVDHELFDDLHAELA